jgi:hypothetical protein
MVPSLRIRLRHEVSLIEPPGRRWRPSRENKVVWFYIGLAGGDAGSVLRLAGRFAVDRPVEAQPPPAEYFFESLTMI